MAEIVLPLFIRGVLCHRFWVSGGYRITVQSQITGPVTPACQPRAEGALRVSGVFGPRGSVLENVRQSGSMKALFPRGAGLTAVMLNTAGGVTGGDRFKVDAVSGSDSTLTMTTQAAERIYRAQPGTRGEIDVALTVEPGAVMNWLPQETIIYDHASARRRLTAKVAPDATLLAVEPLIFGRRAMGETLTHADFSDHWRIWRDDELIFADTLRLKGCVDDVLAGRATGAGAGAMASVLMIKPNAETMLEPLRALLPATGAAGLIRPGVLFARMLAVDGFALRQTLIPALTLLSGGPIPRTWMI